MRVISQKTPAPRLLSTVVPELREKAPERVTIRSRIKSVSVFSGNARGMFFGLIFGGLLICAIGLLYARDRANRQHAAEQRQLLAVSTQSVTMPQPITIKIDAGLVHVTAISLGHPRLAIINGRQVTEGEQILIHTPNANVAVALRVLKIGDGQIQLSDGTQVIIARLELPKPPRPKS